MSYEGKNPTIDTLLLTPGEDPATPQEGELQYADGTDRAIGPYIYNGSSWDAIATSGLAIQTSTKTANYTITTSDDVIFVDGTSSAFTITLPTAGASPRKIYTIRRIDNTLANVITIDGSGSELIDGAANTTLNTIYETITLVSNGTSWSVLSRKTNMPLIDTGAITITSTGTNPTKGTIVRDKFWWTREGQFALCRFEYEQSAAGVAGTGGYLITLPTGLSFDTDYVLVNTSTNNSAANGPNLGYISGSVASAENCRAGVVAYNSTQFRVVGVGGGTDVGFWGLGFLQLSNTQVRMGGWFKFPVPGWKA